MNYLAENSLPIWMGGAIALTMALIVYLQTRSTGALGAVAVIILVAAALLGLERWLETPREAVERTLYELADAVEANDIPATLAHMTANAAIRRDVEESMARVQIERARVLGSPRIEMTADSALVTCRGFIYATDKRGGMKGGAEDELSLTFVEQGGRWLLQDYTSKRNWQRALGR